MPYILDTNICIYITKKKYPSVLDKFNLAPAGEIALSIITVSELEFGARKAISPEKNLASLHQFLLPFKLLDFDYKASVEYGIIKAELQAKGMSIGPFDTLIAAQAKSINYTLVTNNEREFRRITGLAVENWLL